jgi:hypothetical protein
VQEGQVQEGQEVEGQEVEAQEQEVQEQEVQAQEVQAQEVQEVEVQVQVVQEVEVQVQVVQVVEVQEVQEAQEDRVVQDADGIQERMDARVLPQLGLYSTIGVQHVAVAGEDDMEGHKLDHTIDERLV